MAYFLRSVTMTVGLTLAVRSIQLISLETLGMCMRVCVFYEGAVKPYLDQAKQSGLDACTEMFGNLSMRTSVQE